MTAYWKRFCITTGIVVVVFLPAMMREHPSIILMGPWFGTILTLEKVEALRGLSLDTPTWSVVMGLLTLVVIAVASRWMVTAILATIFFITSALLLYAVMSADFGRDTRHEIPRLHCRLPDAFHDLSPQPSLHAPDVDLLADHPRTNSRADVRFRASQKGTISPGPLFSLHLDW